MGKYRVLGSLLDRVFRNNLNANFDDVDADIQAQKKRVDDLIIANPSPSEVQDARLGFPVLRDKLLDVDEQLAENMKIPRYMYNDYFPKSVYQKMLNHEEIRYAIIGHSISQGDGSSSFETKWHSRLEALVEAEFGCLMTNVNWGLGTQGGSKIPGLLFRSALFDYSTIDLVFIVNGANDNDTPTADYRIQYESMIRHILQQSNVVMVIDNPGTTLLPSKHAPETVELSQHYRIPLVNMYNAFIDYGDYKSLLVDTVHPNDAGYQLYADTILSQIKRAAKVDKYLPEPLAPIKGGNLYNREISDTGLGLDFLVTQLTLTDVIGNALVVKMGNLGNATVDVYEDDVVIKTFFVAAGGTAEQHFYMDISTWEGGTLRFQVRNPTTEKTAIRGIVYVVNNDFALGRDFFTYTGTVQNEADYKNVRMGATASITYYSDEEQFQVIAFANYGSPVIRVSVNGVEKFHRQVSNHEDFKLKFQSSDYKKTVLIENLSSSDADIISLVSIRPSVEKNKVGVPNEGQLTLGQNQEAIVFKKQKNGESFYEYELTRV